jgi:hypothetical protein
MRVSAPTIKASKHLIDKIQDHPLAEVRDELIAARTYLAKHGRLALIKAAGIDATAAWGSSVKRVKVNLPAEGRPNRVPESIQQHSLVEVLNQCATLDRLVDAITWVQHDAQLGAFSTVALCHPTTSSSKTAEAKCIDNDLILVAADGRRARFEVCDVASEKDGNNKEQRDLVSLGVLNDCTGAKRLEIGSWTSDRLFLVVSSEFAAGILGRTPSWIKKDHLQYQQFDASDTTKLLEVIKGKGFLGVS